MPEKFSTQRDGLCTWVSVSYRAEVGVSRFLQKGHQNQHKEVNTQNEGDTDVTPGSGFPRAPAAFLLAWVVFPVRASGLLPLQETRGLCCVPQSDTGGLSMRESFVQKPEIRS